MKEVKVMQIEEIFLDDLCFGNNTTGLIVGNPKAFDTVMQLYEQMRCKPKLTRVTRHQIVCGTNRIIFNDDPRGLSPTRVWVQEPVHYIQCKNVAIGDW